MSSLGGREPRAAITSDLERKRTSLRKGKQRRANVTRVGSLSLEFNEKSPANRLVTRAPSPGLSSTETRPNK